MSATFNQQLHENTTESHLLNDRLQERQNFEKFSVGVISEPALDGNSILKLWQTAASDIITTTVVVTMLTKTTWDVAARLFSGTTYEGYNNIWQWPNITTVNVYRLKMHQVQAAEKLMNNDYEQHLETLI